MIFSNDGHTQIGGAPYENALEIAQILKTVRKRMFQVGGKEEDYQTLVAFAGRLSMLNDVDITKFLATIPDFEKISFQDLLKRLEDYTDEMGI